MARFVSTTAVAKPGVIYWAEVYGSIITGDTPQEVFEKVDLREEEFKPSVPASYIVNGPEYPLEQRIAPPAERTELLRRMWDEEADRAAYEARYA